MFTILNVHFSFAVIVITVIITSLLSLLYISGAQLISQLSHLATS